MTSWGDEAGCDWALGRPGFKEWADCLLWHTDIGHKVGWISRIRWKNDARRHGEEHKRGIGNRVESECDTGFRGPMSRSRIGGRAGERTNRSNRCGAVRRPCGNTEIGVVRLVRQYRRRRIQRACFSWRSLVVVSVGRVQAPLLGPQHTRAGVRKPWLASTTPAIHKIFWKYRI